MDIGALVETNVERELADCGYKVSCYDPKVVLGVFRNPWVVVTTWEDVPESWEDDPTTWGDYSIFVFFQAMSSPRSIDKKKSKRLQSFYNIKIAILE